MRQWGTSYRTTGLQGPPPTHPPANSATDEQIRALVDTYGDLIYKVAVAIVRSPSLADDVVQETLLRAWTSMPSWEGDVPVRWVRRVARNVAISMMRKENRLVHEDQWSDSPGGDAAVDTIVEGKVEVAAMWEALGTLDEVSRTLIVLREAEELSYEEIGRIVGLTPSAVKAKLYRARHALKERLRAWD